jgi:hypothetical protein
VSTDEGRPYIRGTIPGRRPWLPERRDYVYRGTGLDVITGPAVSTAVARDWRRQWAREDPWRNRDKKDGEPAGPDGEEADSLPPGNGIPERWRKALDRLRPTV